MKNTPTTPPSRRRSIPLAKAKKLFEQLTGEELADSLVAQYTRSQPRFGWAPDGARFSLDSVVEGLLTHEELWPALLRQHGADSRRLLSFLDRLLAEQTIQYLRQGQFAFPNQLSSNLAAMVPTEETGRSDYRTLCLSIFGQKNPENPAVPQTEDARFVADLLSLHILDPRGLIRFLRDLLCWWTRLYAGDSAWRRKLAILQTREDYAKLRAKAHSNKGLRDHLARYAGLSPRATESTLRSFDRQRQRLERKCSS